ncbi:carbamoyl-phosphate synthase large subunit [Spirochaeta dissipatitropha]
MPARKDISSILIFGSGPIVIGQACEFDYSGNQAVRALREEGYRVILVNPNPATVMTTPGNADVIYMDPLEVPYIEDIIKREKPDAVLPTMGGQTALNLTLELAEQGIFEKYGIEILGADINAIQVAEDRGKFKELMTSIGLENPNSTLVSTLDEARDFLAKVGVPVIIRPSFTLGGRGGSIAYSVDQFDEYVEWALSESPVHQVLLDESLLGWKEFELEVMRDKADNAVVVCSIENLDPMGIHTGDSITVAPIQTLSDREYQKMRTAAIRILQAVGVECGGSNVQFAVNPEDGRMVIIEMNPRVSRSSALASKATGFPIARCAAKLAVGFTLDEILNDITGKTVSCFEPSLDYVAVKVPRFELEKFPGGYAELGTQMKSVGESLAIGRTFIEALNKGIRAGEFGFTGLEDIPQLSDEEIDRMTQTLHPRRIFAAYTKLCRGGHDAVKSVIEATAYDPWFVHEMSEFAILEKRLQKEELTADLLLSAKRSGLSDKRIARLRGVSEKEVTAFRFDNEMHASYHFVDTCSGEFAADTPYFYSTYGEIDEGGSSGEDAVVILASGPNRIGQGLEFDTCCTLSSMAYRRQGVKTIIINSNPETVSTDFNVSDRLYLEPLTAEDVLSVIRKEKVKNVVVQLGGQTPLNMADDLQAAGVKIVGTSVDAIKGVEDRGLFADLVNKLNLRQPVNRMAGTVEDVYRCAEEIGYPVLLRPSFVLGGRSMVIAYTQQELEAFLAQSIVIEPDSPVLVDQFLEDAFEYDVDAVSDGQNVYLGGIMQHIEAAGVHSGDSACVFPPYKSTPAILDQMKKATAEIAREIGVQGFLNIQFAVKHDMLYVLEVNPRASRTVPFISKASGVDLVDAAVKIWLGQDLIMQGLVSPNAEYQAAVGDCVVGWAVKEAMFSFDRFRDHDPLLGPEMKSTGEVIGIGADFGEAFAKATQATGTQLPVSGRVFVSVHEDDKPAVLEIVKEFASLGFEICATRGTADFLFQNNVFTEVILKVHEGHPNIIDHMRSKRVDILINTPRGRFTQMDDSYLRIESVRRKIPYTTTISAARAALEGIRHLQKGEIISRPLLDSR